MKVKITQASGRGFWYKDKIGQVFDVDESSSHPGNYVRTDNRNFWIDKRDCEVAAEPTAPQPAASPHNKYSREVKRVRCIDNLNAEESLNVGTVYDVERENGATDWLLKEERGSWRKDRFEIVESVTDEPFTAQPPAAPATIDSHYNFTYSLSKQDIDTGAIKIDPYFVNKVWGVSSKDDTGVVFHLLKTLARYSDKNTKQREITAMYKSIKRLAELEGVSLD